MRKFSRASRLYYKLTPRFIRRFLQGVENLVNWIPTVWTDHSWDHTFIYRILSKKLEIQREYLVLHGWHDSVESTNRYITLALNLIQRTSGEYYVDEFIEDYWDLYNIKANQYLTKYKSTTRKVLKQQPELAQDPSRLCSTVAYHQHEKCKRLLFKVLEEKIDYWWE
jgi:hypothetical protein